MTVCFTTFLWKGWSPRYNAEHVNALGRQLRGHCKGDFRFVCVTDMPEGITEAETMPLWPEPDIKKFRRQNCFTRMRLFDPEINSQLGDVVMQIDLDAVILDDLMPLLEGFGDFKAMRGWSAPLNGSMFALRAGTNAHLWFDLIERKEAFFDLVMKNRAFGLIGSDQVWMSLKIPNAEKWQEKDGIYQFSRASRPDKRQGARVVFFAGHFKPWDDVCRMKAPDLYDVYAEHFVERVAA